MGRQEIPDRDQGRDRLLREGAACLRWYASGVPIEDHSTDASTQGRPTGSRSHVRVHSAGRRQRTAGAGGGCTNESHGEGSSGIPRSKFGRKDLYARVPQGPSGASRFLGFVVWTVQEEHAYPREAS